MRVTFFAVSLFLLTACAFAVAQEPEKNAGTITGKINSPYARRSEAVVYIEQAPGEFPPPAENPVVDQVKLVFIAHVLPVVKGTTVDFANSDPVLHNIFSPPKSVEQFNLGTYGKGAVRHHTFNKIGEVQLLCNVHAEMSAFVIVCQNPYFAVSDKKTGRFTIENVPAGTYKLTFWHERLRPKAKEVTVTAGQTAEVTFSNLRR